ncbi:hypothetical protein PCANC_02606 [Puccinia coronata f. sp. avenae]|uniref:Uncharacterized protein n=1 Tax=Puccinia coronata f. sp. avenae TaxID=200324 RepID=A0A2N5W5L0_9BASI|nr:hypothetical protein PCASD_26145 [Puccinia coronata f. sp. avenae]PLW57521.1 hypothetical protein PCANC_02606 [Puccinia coronata f. sp. avenae]
MKSVKRTVYLNCLLPLAANWKTTDKTNFVYIPNSHLLKFYTELAAFCPSSLWLS